MYKQERPASLGINFVLMYYETGGRGFQSLTSVDICAIQYVYVYEKTLKYSSSHSVDNISLFLDRFELKL